MIDIESLENKIKQTKAKIGFVQSSIVLYPKLHRDYALSRADAMMLKFERYSFRALYFAENFLAKLRTVKKLPRTQIASKEEFVISVGDGIYFEFDAFVTFCKSIVEGNIIEDAKSLSSPADKLFLKIAAKYKNDFIEKLLNPLRIEIVHLNNFGTSIGSLATFDADNDLMKLKSNYNDGMGNDVDLAELFSEVVNTMTDIIDEILGVFIMDYTKRYGVPEKDTSFVTNHGTISFNSFDIPGFPKYK